jgi:two-component system, NarL family, sensor histidine kinase UhpB
MSLGGCSGAVLARPWLLARFSVVRVGFSLRAPQAIVSPAMLRVEHNARARNPVPRINERRAAANRIPGIRGLRSIWRHAFVLAMRERMHLYWRSLAARTFVAGAAVLVLIFILLLASPVEVSYPIRLGQAAILLGGLLAMLVIQLLLVRRVMSPLNQLAEQMQHIDLRQPQQRLAQTTDQTAEISAFVGAFNTMLERLADERRRSTQAALGAQEAERLRTAQELHDQVGQSLTAVALQVEGLAGEADQPTAERLSELARQLQGTLDDIRRIVRKLRPEALDDLGLINALIALTSRIADQSQLRLERDLDGNLPSLSPEQELVIYRVAQEALFNVIRHAQARTARIALAPEDSGVVLTISDDGRGMENREAGSGISGMHERALLVGASLSIDSQPQRGTRVRLMVPVGSTT